MEYSAKELLALLNDQDENPWIEAKGGCESTHTVLETVCAYSNEPGLGGGYLLMGVGVESGTLFPQYKINNISDPDKFQRDFASQCASSFNIPVRPAVSVEKINDSTVIKIWVPELPARQKPLYFKAEGLPGGALRRIGSTDQHCTEDDMLVFYQDNTSYDQTPVTGTTLNDIDETALNRYRYLRANVLPTAEELTFSDEELLVALGCVNKQNKTELNLAGVLLFGTSKIQRATFPMLRVDYIRVPGNTWVEDPDNRFTTIDMRGSIILLLYRLIDAINADLPKGFLLPDDDIQASSVGLPLKALREAIVNALMHRSYREHRPTQVIRYNNRIEIINPGFSLKSEDQLGEPGSETRNPFIAAVFHETNLAETKGSGIRAMKKLMKDAHLVPPTFESSRERNEFVSRMLLHHFLDDSDLQWLKQFDHFSLTDSQKQALIFVREVGAIDNQTYRQMSDCEMHRASAELRALRMDKLLESKGRGRATYYVAGIGLKTNGVKNESNQLLMNQSSAFDSLNTEGDSLNTEGDSLSTEGVESINNEADSLSTEGQYILNTEGDSLNTEGENSLSTEAAIIDRNSLLEGLPEALKTRVLEIKERENDKAKVKELILDLCSIRPLKLIELASLLQKGDNYISRSFIKPMLGNKELKYLHPEMFSHPEQAYVKNEK
jgi:ATP-dependent DNA helicase RecG